MISIINRTIAAGMGQEEEREAWRPTARLLAWVLHRWWGHQNNSLRSWNNNKTGSVPRLFNGTRMDTWENTSALELALPM